MSRHLIARVEDGRVLTEGDGALPSLMADEPDDAELLAHVGADVLLAPGQRMADGTWIHGASVRRGVVTGGGRGVVTGGGRGVVTGGDGADLSSPDGPTGSRIWVPLADLQVPTDVAERVRQAVRQWAEPPPGRADWYRAGWCDEVEGWVDEVLPDGVVRSGDVEVERVWSLSAVLRVPTGEGDLWFKATCEHFEAEASLTVLLASRFPDLLPPLVAVDQERAWMLMRPLQGPGAADVEPQLRDPEFTQALVRALSALQHDGLPWAGRLRAAGCPERGLDHTVHGWRRMLVEGPELALLTEDEIGAARANADRVEALLAEFWSCGIPDTISHGDLHLGNVAWGEHELRIFDWTDVCLSHPFLDTVHVATSAAAPSVDPGTRRRPDPEIMSALTTPWRAARPQADVDRALVLAPFANRVFQAVSYLQISDGLEPGSAPGLTGVVAHFLRDVPRLVDELR